MLEDAERHKRVYIEQVSHGNSERISRTCRLVKSDASGPPLKTGRDRAVFHERVASWVRASVVEEVRTALRSRKLVNPLA